MKQKKYAKLRTSLILSNISTRIVMRSHGDDNEGHGGDRDVGHSGATSMVTTRTMMVTTAMVKTTACGAGGCSSLIQIRVEWTWCCLRNQERLLRTNGDVGLHGSKLCT